MPCGPSTDQPRDGMHEHGFAECRPGARHAEAVHRRFHVDEGKRHELGEAAGFRLQVAQRKQMFRP